MGMVEIGRYHLAGFSEHQIMEELASPSRSSRVTGILYAEMVAALGKLLLTDPATDEKFVPGIGELLGVLEIEPDSSIDFARINAVSKPVNAFVNGDYSTCATFGRYGASIFGRHLFYQLSIIGHVRLGRKEAAESAGKAAKMGLLISPWHLRLTELTLGLVTATDLIPEAQDGNARFQVKVFEGIRALSSGDKAQARTCLTAALTMPNDLPFEYLMAKADLDRGARTSDGACA
jgi:hypothetical protein